MTYLHATRHARGTSRGVLSRRVRRHCFPHARFHAPSKCIHSRDSAVINGAVVLKNIKMSTSARRAVSAWRGIWRPADNSGNFLSSRVSPRDEKPSAIQLEAKAFSTCDRSPRSPIALEASIRDASR